MSGRISNEVNGQTTFPNDAEKWAVPNNPGKYTIAIKVRRSIEEQYCSNPFATDQSGKWSKDESVIMNDIGAEWAESEQVYEGTATCPQFNEEVVVREDPDTGKLYWMSSTGVNMMNMLGMMGEGGTLAGLFGGVGLPMGKYATGIVDACDQIAGAVAPIDINASGARVSSRMGLRTDPVTGESKASHGGVDVAAPIGTALVAILDGVVEQARGTTIGGTAVGGFGAWVVLKHKAIDGCGKERTIYSIYGHVHKSYVKKGDTVAKGQRVADVGNEGKSTGPHLHFEVHYDRLKSKNSRRNPIYALGLDKVGWAE